MDAEIVPRTRSQNNIAQAANSSSLFNERTDQNNAKQTVNIEKDIQNIPKTQEEKNIEQTQSIWESKILVIVVTVIVVVGLVLIYYILTQREKQPTAPPGINTNNLPQDIQHQLANSSSFNERTDQNIAKQHPAGSDFDRSLVNPGLNQQYSDNQNLQHRDSDQNIANQPRQQPTGSDFNYQNIAKQYPMQSPKQALKPSIKYRSLKDKMKKVIEEKNRVPEENTLGPVTGEQIDNPEVLLPNQSVQIPLKSTTPSTNTAGSTNITNIQDVLDASSMFGT